MEKNSKNYWPHALIASILLIVLACIYTIVKSLEYPVEMDTYYMQKYQDVEKNFDKIKAAQEGFDERYVVYFETNSAKGGDVYVGEGNELRVVINEKNQTYPNLCSFDANVELLLTRPETNKYNQNLTNSDSEKCRWFFPAIAIEKLGRWQFQTKITIGEYVGFFTHEVNVTREAPALLF
ncbi:MAG: hypothetical protein LBS73_01340 [Campylobacteraceae bacterium]|jgi:hypothetical protein|nr:hypothetical protein [Campylobacteraceae bacterium]